MILFVVCQYMSIWFSFIMCGSALSGGTLIMRAGGVAVGSWSHAYAFPDMSCHQTCQTVTLNCLCDKHHKICPKVCHLPAYACQRDAICQAILYVSVITECVIYEQACFELKQSLFFIHRTWFCHSSLLTLIPLFTSILKWCKSLPILQHLWADMG